MIEPLMSDFITPLLGALAGGASVYAAIRSDLAALQARITIVEKSNDKAHDRIDGMMGSAK